MIVRLLKSSKVSQGGKKNSSCIHLVSCGVQDLYTGSSKTLKTYLMLKFCGIFGDMFTEIIWYRVAMFCFYGFVFFFFNVSFCFIFNSVRIDSVKEKQMSWESFW